MAAILGQAQRGRQRVNGAGTDGQRGWDAVNRPGLDAHAP